MTRPSAELIKGRYQIAEFVASGSMGAVYKGVDLELGRVIAAKLVKARGDASVKDVALREARVLARINHPNTLSVYDIIEEDEQAWIICEWLEGSSLARIQRPLKPLQVAAIMVQLLEALTATHRAEVYHRDVKPENLFITSEGRVILIDFGVAFTASNSTGETMAGSLRYLDSRILEGERADCYSDLFSAMLVMLELLRGRPMLPDLAPLPLYRYLKHDFPLDFDGLVEGLYPPLISLARRFTVEEARGRDGAHYKAPAKFAARVAQEIFRSHSNLSPVQYLAEHHPLSDERDLAGEAAIMAQASEYLHSQQVSPQEKAIWLAFKTQAARTDDSTRGVGELKVEQDNAGQSRRAWLEHARHLAVVVVLCLGLWAVWNKSPSDMSPIDRDRIDELARPFTGMSEPNGSGEPLAPAPVGKSGEASGLVAVRFVANAWADIAIDGVPAGRLPSGKPFRLKRGMRRISLSSPYVEPLEATIEVDQTDDGSKFHFVLTHKTVVRTLKVSEPAEITVDAKTYHVEDEIDLPLPFGTVAVAVKSRDEPARIEAITFDASSPRVVRLF